MSLTIPPDVLAARRARQEGYLAEVGRAHVALVKSAAKPALAPVLTGRLVVSASGWGLLEVPSALARGIFDAIHEPGIELPLRDGKLRAHISVFTKDEIDKIGPANLTEKGHTFSYQLGPIKTVKPSGWDGVAKVFMVEVTSPGLKKLRRTYGLSDLPHNDHPFHITCGIVRVGVRAPGPIAKAAGADPAGHDPIPTARHDREGSGAEALGGAGRSPDPMPAIGRALDRLLTSPDGEPWSDSAAWYNPHTGKCRVSVGDSVAGYAAVAAAIGAIVGQNNVEVSDEGGPPTGPGWLRIIEQEGKAAAARTLDDPWTFGCVCETCGRAAVKRPPFDKCPECSGDIIPAITENLTNHRFGLELTGKYYTRTKESASRATDDQGQPCPDGECCPHCGARLERGDDGDCNRCGEPWPDRKTDAGRKAMHDRIAALDDGEKTAFDWQAAKAQLPGFHLPETLAGAGLGAAAGGLVGALRGPTPTKSRWRRALEHAGIGAAAGGVAGDVAGDRMRRYISNTVTPFGYDHSPMAAIRPRNMRQVWDAAVLDKPIFDRSEPEYYNNIGAKGDDYLKSNWRDYYIPARRELLRRTLGVHTTNPTTDFWARGPDGRYGINPGRADLDAVINRFAGYPETPIKSDFLKFPDFLLDEAKGKRGAGPLLSSASNATQQVSSTTRPDGTIDAAVDDNWDFDLPPKDQVALRAGVKQLRGGRRPAAGWGGTAARWLMDKVISDEKPVVHQPMRFTPTTPGGPFQLQFLGPGNNPLGSPIKAGAFFRLAHPPGLRASVDSLLGAADPDGMPLADDRQGKGSLSMTAPIARRSVLRRAMEAKDRRERSQWGEKIAALPHTSILGPARSLTLMTTPPPDPHAALARRVMAADAALAPIPPGLIAGNQVAGPAPTDVAVADPALDTFRQGVMSALTHEQIEPDGDPFPVPDDDDNHGDDDIDSAKEAAAHPALPMLLRAKAHSDRRDWKRKHALMRALLHKYKGEFYRDSAKGRFAGITHRPTGFKIHVPRAVAAGVKAASVLPYNAAMITALMPRRMGSVAAPRVVAPGIDPVHVARQQGAELEAVHLALARMRPRRRAPAPLPPAVKLGASTPSATPSTTPAATPSAATAPRAAGGIAGLAAGGIAGAAAGMRPAAAVIPQPPEDPPPIPTGLNKATVARPVTTRETLGQNIGHYYANAPGGFAGSVDRAIANRAPVPGMQPLYWQAADTNREATIKYLPGAIPGYTNAAGTTDGNAVRLDMRPLMAARGRELQTRELPAHDQAVRDRDNAAATIRLNREHELSHSALDMMPARAAGDLVQPGAPLPTSPGPNADAAYHDYAASPQELIPRVAELKRQWVEAHPGRDVASPAAAESVLQWYAKNPWVRRGPRGPAESLDAWDLQNHPELRQRILRLMPQVVNNPAVAPGLKAAAYTSHESSAYNTRDTKLDISGVTYANTRTDEDGVVQDLVRDAATLREPEQRELQGLRGSWDQGLQAVGKVRELLRRHGRQAREPFDRTPEQQSRVQPRQLLLAADVRTAAQSPQLPVRDVRRPDATHLRLGQGDGDSVRDNQATTHSGLDTRTRADNATTHRPSGNAVPGTRRFAAQHATMGTTARRLPDTEQDATQVRHDGRGDADDSVRGHRSTLQPQEQHHPDARRRDVGAQGLGGEARDTVLDTPHARTQGVSGRANSWAAKVAAIPDSQPIQPYQQRVVDKVRNNGNLLVYHGLGSGKTRSAITAAEAIGEPYTAVVPASLRGNFASEISRWSDGKTPHDIMSYTGAALGKQPATDPGTLILDEVQRIRNPASAQSQAAMALARRANRSILLSGTPIVNQPSDLAVPLSILTGNNISPDQFNQQFLGKARVSPGFWGWMHGVGDVQMPAIKHRDKLEKLLWGHVDYQPSKTPEGVDTNEERVEVDLSPDQQRFYKGLWGQLNLVTRWKLQHDYPLTRQELTNLHSFMTGPRQAALSLLPFTKGQGDPLKEFGRSGKLVSAMAKLKETLASNPRAKAIIYSNFIDAGLTPYAAALKAAGIPHTLFHGGMSPTDQQKALADYNADRSRVLLLGPAGSEGISARGTQLIQLLDPYWNEARLNQAQGRGLRFDSHVGLPENLRNVKIQRFIAKMPQVGFWGKLVGGEDRPSADEVLERMSRGKEQLNEQFRDVLRDVGSRD